MLPVFPNDEDGVEFVNRSAVEQVFQSWKNSQISSEDSHSKSDSGLHPGSQDSFHQRRYYQSTPISEKQKKKKKKKTKSITMYNEDDGRSDVSPVGTLKLPRIYPSKQPIGLNRHTMRQNFPSFQSPTHDRRRFITVVRPLSVFPEPPLPPNYSVTSKLLNSSYPSQLLKGRPPSPAPFTHSRQSRSNFAISGQGVGPVPSRENGISTTSLKVNLAGGSGWDLTALRRGYAGPKIQNGPGNLKQGDNRYHYHGTRYQSQGTLSNEEKLNHPPWNPNFAYAKNYPLTDDWRRHIEARRKALQRRRSRRRGIADGDSTITNGEKRIIGDSQTEENFEELLRRSNEAESGIQTDHFYETKKSNYYREKTDHSTQVIIDELPDYQESIVPVLEQLVAHTLEQCFLEVLEEQEIYSIRQRRKNFNEKRLAEITTSKLLNVEV